MFCGKCGAPIKDGVNFCAKCGAPFHMRPRRCDANLGMPSPVKKTEGGYNGQVDRKDSDGGFFSPPEL